MSINNCQVIQKSYIDRSPNAWLRSVQKARPWFVTVVLLYKVLLITNYTKLTLLTVQYAAYTTYMTIKLFTTHYLQYNTIQYSISYNLILILITAQYNFSLLIHLQKLQLHLAY